MKLHARTRAVLAAIQQQPGTVAEIQARVGLEYPDVRNAVMRLVGHGLIAREYLGRVRGGKVGVRWYVPEGAPLHVVQAAPEPRMPMRVPEPDPAAAPVRTVVVAGREWDVVPVESCYCGASSLTRPARWGRA